MLDHTADPSTPSENHNAVTNPSLYRMRAACRACGNAFGTISERNGQDVVRCARCNTYAYCAPKTETGKPQRSVRSREEVKPSVRFQVLGRARGICELCNQHRDLHIAHLLSVAEGLELGYTEEQLNRPENLAAFCEECNLGQGRNSVDPLVYLALCRRRLERGGE